LFLVAAAFYAVPYLTLSLEYGTTPEERLFIACSQTLFRLLGVIIALAGVPLLFGASTDAPAAAFQSSFFVIALIGLIFLSASIPS